MRLPWRQDRERARARAVVIDAEGIEGEYGPWGAKLKLRVHFDDGTTGEFETKKRTIDLGGRIATEGDILPVLYDPDDRSKVDLDVDASDPAASFNEAAAQFAADSPAFLVSSVATRAKSERATNGGAMPTETLKAIEHQHLAGAIDDATYEELRTKILSGEI